MQRTPFSDYHNKHNARMVDFAGWEMPLIYTSIIEEHKQCRDSGAVFDVSHMGRLHLKGPSVRRFLERIATRKVSDMKVGQARYSLVCKEDGGVLDDILIYRLEDKWMIVCNASNREKIVNHLNDVAKAENIKVNLKDVTLDTAMLAVQGPKVMDVIGKLSSTIPQLKNYWFTEKNLMVLKLMVSRTGYTGEDGVEVILPAKVAGMAVKLLLETDAAKAVVKPAGLGARDTLRIEAGMPLYGHEITEDVDPISAGLNFGVSLKKHEASTDELEIPRFIGQDAIEKVAAEGAKRKMIGLKMDGRRTPRQGAKILIDGKEAGIITSGCMSPTIGCPIAMGFVDKDLANPEQKIEIDFNGKTESATLCALPFYKRAKK